MTALFDIGNYFASGKTHEDEDLNMDFYYYEFYDLISITANVELNLSGNPIIASLSIRIPNANSSLDFSWDEFDERPYRGRPFREIPLRNDYESYEEIPEAYTLHRLTQIGNGLAAQDNYPEIDREIQKIGEEILSRLEKIAA